MFWNQIFMRSSIIVLGKPVHPKWTMRMCIWWELGYLLLNDENICFLPRHWNQETNDVVVVVVVVGGVFFYFKVCRIELGSNKAIENLSFGGPKNKKMMIEKCI